MKNDEKDLNSSDDEYHEYSKDQNDRHQRHKSSEKDNSAKQIQQTPVVQDPSASKQYLQFFYDLNHEINHSQKNQCNQLQTNITSQIPFEKFFNYLDHLQDSLIQQLRANDFIVANTSSKIQSHTDNPKIQFQFKILRYIPSFEVVQLLCKLGKFSKTFTVLNNFYDNSQQKIKYQRLKQPNKQKIKQKRQDLPFFKYSQKLQSLGSYSDVYNLQFLKQRFIIKCISFKGSHKLPFHAILKEIFIASMMSALRIGPKIKRINGFDFCVNSDCVEFSMQECKILGYPSQRDEQDLKICLLKMHALRMCHIDIKPHNLMYSVEYKKAVLIDFGIQQLLQKRVGNKTKTRYNGTIQFSSPQMSKLFKGSSDFVDLYLNDIYGVRLSLKRMNQKIQQKQTSQTPNKQVNEGYKFHIHKRSYLELIREQSEITYKQATTNKLLFNQLLKRVIETFRFIKNERLQQNFNQYHSQQFLSQYSQELKSKRSSLLNQLLAQLTKCLVFKYRVHYLDNYAGQEMNDLQLNRLIIKLNALESIGDQLNYFQKLLNKQFLEQSQNYFLRTQPSLFYYNFFNREKTLQIKNFYNSRIIELQTNQSLSQRLANNSQPSKFSNNSQGQKLNPFQQLKILSDKNKIKSEFFSNNDKQIDFIDILVQHLKFTNSKGTTILNKLQIVQILKKKTFQEFINIYLYKTSQNCEIFKYFVGLTNSLNQNSNSQNFIQFCVNLPFQHEKNKRLTPIFQVYQRILNIILYSEKIRQNNIQLYKSNKIYLNHFNQLDSILPSPLKESQQNTPKESKRPSEILNEYSKLDQELIKQLKFHLPDVIKSAIFLGFNYYNWLKSLLKLLLRQIVSRKHLKRHFILVCLKQFLQIGVISDNFHTLVEQKQMNGRPNRSLKYDLFNPKVFEDLKQNLKKQLTMFCLDEQFQMGKIQIIPYLWIFFNYQLVKLSIAQSQLVDMFSLFESSLNKQFSQFSSEQQFEYYPLYKQVMQSIKDLSLIKYVKVLSEYWRNSALIQGSDQTYKKLWNSNKNMYQSKYQKIEKYQINIINQRNTKELSIMYQENQTFQLPPPLNYYILTDPIHYGFQKQPARHKVSQKSLIPIDIHLIANELTLYLHLPIRAQYLLNKKSQKQFQEILFKVCDSKMNNFHNIKTIIKLVDLLVDFINNNEKTDLKLNESIKLLWTQCFKIIDFVKVRSSESQDAFERQYLHLTYVQVLQKIKSLFALMSSNSSNKNLKQLTKFEVLANYDSITNIMNSYQSYHHENINIRIFNGYIENQLLSSINKKYPQIQFYKETRIVEILSNIQADFIEINERKIMADKLVQKEVTQNIEEEQKSVMSKELWRLLLQIIFVQILPLTKVVNYQNSTSLIKNIYQQQKHFTYNQEQLAIHCTINVLKSCLFYNVDNLKEFWKVFLYYLEKFVCNQRKIQNLDLIKQQDLDQRLVQQTFPIFWLFSQSISQNMKSQILGVLFQLMKQKKYNNLRLLTYVFILIQQKAYHFSKELSQQQQGIKNLKKIYNILLKKPFQNKKLRFFEQFYINFILLDVSINKQKSSKVHFLVKKLIKNLQQQSPYNRNTLKYVIQQYLYNGLEQNNKRQRNTLSKQIIKLHFSKRLRYFNTMVKTNNINYEVYFDNNQKAMLHRSQNFLQSMNNNKAQAQLNSLIHSVTERENKRKYRQKMLSQEQRTKNKGEMIQKQKQNNDQKQQSVENKQQRDKQKQSFKIETELSEKVSNLKADLVYNFQIPKYKIVRYMKKFTEYIVGQNLCL